MSQQAQQQQQQQQAASLGDASDKKKESAAADDEDKGDVDETGLEQDDINVVMSQANCSRARGQSPRPSPRARVRTPFTHLHRFPETAVKALKATDGDIVQAILDAN